MCLTTSMAALSYRDMHVKCTLLWTARVEFVALIFFCSLRAFQTVEEGTMGQWCRRIYGKTVKAFAPQCDVAAALAFLGHYLKMSACHCLPCSQCRLSHASFPLQGKGVQGNLCHFTKTASFAYGERKVERVGHDAGSTAGRAGWKNSGKSWHSCVSFACNGQRKRAERQMCLI